MRRLTLLPLLVLQTALLALLTLLLSLLPVLPLLRLLRALLHALVHRLQALHEIARLVRSLLLLRTTTVLRNGLRLLQPLSEIRDVRADLLLRGVHPILRRAA